MNATVRLEPAADAGPVPTSATFGLDPVEDAIRAMAAGRPVLVVDNEDRENEGDIIFAAQHATPALMGWTIRYSSGVICVPLPGERAAVPVEQPAFRREQVRPGLVEVGLVQLGVRQPDLHRLAVQGQREVLFGEAGEVDVGVDRAGGDEQRPLAGDEARHPVHVVFDVEHDLEVSDRGVVLADVLD